MELVNSKVKEIIDKMNKGYYFVDKDRRIRFWNKKAELITGYKAEELINSRCSDNILKHTNNCGEELCKANCPLVSAMEQNKIEEEHVFLEHKDGSKVSVNVKVIPIFDEKGLALGAIELFDREYFDINDYKKIVKNKK